MKVLLLALLLAAQTPDEVLRQIDAATRLVDSGKVDEAITALKAIVTAHPDQAVAKYELALAYSAKGDPEHCRQLLETAGETPTVLGMLGNCYDDLGQRDKAIATYRRGLKLDPNDSQLTYNLAVTLAKGGNLDEARELLKTDTRANPWHSSGHLLLAKIFESQNFRVPAIFAYLHFLALDPGPRAKDAATHLQALLNLGFEKTKKGATITFDPNVPKEEGDYGGLTLFLGLSAAADKGEKRSDFEKARDQVASTIHLFTEEEREPSDYTAAVQKPFFASMEKAKLVDTFAAVAVTPLHLKGTDEWVKSHGKDLARYSEWIDPQTGRPGVTTKAH
jgi:tetratricopeptide (TPR) repeat protein